jgi:predicted acetyltransferase
MVDLEVVLASDGEYPIVRNLARFYIYDMAVHAGWAFPADGLFDPGDRFACYWGGAAAPDASVWCGFPFLLRLDGHPAGFALVRRVSAAPLTFDMGEFFVARQHCRHGIGRRAATALFDTFGGCWEVRQLPANTPAQQFWRRVIADYTGGAFTETREVLAAHGQREFIVQRFCCPDRAASRPA